MYIFVSVGLASSMESSSLLQWCLLFLRTNCFNTFVLLLLLLLLFLFFHGDTSVCLNLN